MSVYPEQQALVDAFYWKNGDCCAGCDHWEYHNGGVIGDCKKSRLVAGKDRVTSMGIANTTLPIESGHIMTRREFTCGNFEDNFDWKSLGIFYLRRVGAKVT